MKIIVMDSANVRIEFFDVADNMLNDNIEKFLAEHYISLNSVSWMAAPITMFRSYYMTSVLTRKPAKRCTPFALQS